MASKAAKLKQKRAGRPRKEGYREPNGRISRAQEPADKLAVETRCRHLGITRDQAMDQKAGSFIGYLNLLGPVDGLSTAQYDAAMAFIDLRTRWQRTIQSPGAIYDPNAIGGEGLDPDAYADWVKRIGQQYNAARHAIQEAQFENKHENLWAAVDMVIFRDQPLHNLIGATRIICNALQRHFRIAEAGRTRNAA